MAELKRSYYLPTKLVTAFSQECDKSGYVKQDVVAAAVMFFLDSTPEQRMEMFNRLEKFQASKK